MCYHAEFDQLDQTVPAWTMEIRRRKMPPPPRFAFQGRSGLSDIYDIITDR